MTADIAARLAAAGIRVKPLDWENDNWYCRIRAKTPVGDYVIWWGYNGGKHSLRFDDCAVTEHADIEAAKLDAQSDYESRILAQLECTPQEKE